MTPEPVSRRSVRILFTAVALGGLTLDVLTKVLAVRTLQPGEPVPLLGQVLQLYLIRNPGAAFSIGEGFTWIFTCLAVLVLAGLLRFVVPAVRHRGWAVGLGLVVAGITGNLIDRLVRPPGFARGHVVDFLMLPYWPVFNVADMCVVGGAILVLLIWVVRGVGHDGTVEQRGTRKSPIGGEDAAREPRP
ncbi:signal peptidase II [Naumannella sp. ID2617S]|uniref:Lipoprotein signal peptidase n=1 Tax=Enemella dayhoffiae TaxID=2016507 RepID=A0A255HA53_9ACTN|nr:signal peptidase II [Enemella dayhoffiae]NNG18586.1 signal peptidase II [Naumannella sp. ID2617S]OYO24670.1 signal peptidase II [Enemella dayhoffiae]